LDLARLDLRVPFAERLDGIKMDTSPGVNKLYYRRGAEYGFDQPWEMPLLKGRWIDFVFHVRMSKRRAGFREQWVNVGTGWKRSLFDGKTICA
jgi:hypothetical protein